MTFHTEKDQGGIVTLTMDMPGRSANVIDDEFARLLAATLEQLAADSSITGIILTSAKKSFLAGGNLEWLIAATDAETVFRSAEKIKALFRRLETFGKPIVAAINGSALGGGLELALACHYRVAVDDTRIRLGFPEVTLGLLPGAGGVTRLTRMLGLQAAFPYVTEGNQVGPREALAAGLIDALAADQQALPAAARDLIVAHPDATQPWDRPGFRIPGGEPNHPRVAQMLAVAPAILRKKTYGNYPAPEAILSTMFEGALVDFATACRIESRYFATLATGQVAKNMIRVFWFQLNEIASGKSRPPGIAPQKTLKVGVLGAGMMGHGIAYVTARAGMPVVLKDVTLDKAQQGKERCAALLRKQVSRGRMAVEVSDETLARIQPTADAADLAGCDLVIEAVFEDRDLKGRVTEETEVQIGKTAVFASNTSSLPISSLAERSQRPEQFIGLHFFSPVERMKLVEIICGQKTSAETLAKAFDFVHEIGKTPIVVNDSRGFYTSRVFSTYVQEGMALLGEGCHPRAIESAGLHAGMPVGPLAVTDEVGLGLMRHIRDQARADFAAQGLVAPTHPSDAVLDTMTDMHGRLGKAHGAGFYDYPQNGPKHLWPELLRIFAVNGQTILQETMIERLMFAQALETVRCLEEGVLSSVADANVGSIFGWGFAPFKGGTLQYINDYGLAAFVARGNALALRFGERFRPPLLLEQFAEAGRTFE
jgi:3-hydroxyacyl-CoA dehydrogenase/enoyl-CoA hydratase/3-hydroxybutyryl-CoA epimerase